jgi:L-histidine Nalpha-methyltransferase
MKSIANVAIHASQFPEKVRHDLLASLRSRQVNHKFHYDSVKQTQKWLALHQVYSPSRNDADCTATYDRAFAEAVGKITAKRVHVVGLGCGGGQKDTRLLKLLKARVRETCYTPCDVSTAMVLVAREAALKVLPGTKCFPLVADLAAADDLPVVMAKQNSSGSARLITFFGMIPNFEPQLILPKLASLVRRGDSLLFSANLAPGRHYAAGMRQILPQYDNAPTREWLLTFLLDLGVERGDGKLNFKVESGTGGLKRIIARFHFARAVRFQIESETFEFRSGESLRLFFSYRYTPARVSQQLARHGLKVLDQWITQSGEEGVFLCCRIQ